MTIQVDGVPSHLRKPGVYNTLNTAGAKKGLPVAADKILLIGTLLAAGSATSAVPEQILDPVTARTQFGEGSPVALMAQALFDQEDALYEVWGVGLSEAGGAVAASGTLVFTASSLAAGTAIVYVGGVRVEVGVTTADTETTVAAALVTAINAKPKCAFTASASTSTLTLTAKTKGTQGNDWKFRFEYSSTGLTAVVTQPSSGATDPDVQDALDAVANAQYDIMVCEYNDATSLGKIKTHLDTVSGPLELKPGIALAATVDGTLSNATTLGSGVDSGRVGLAYLRNAYDGALELAAKVAGLFAGEPDRARPLNGLALHAVAKPAQVDWLSRSEQESCLNNGVMPLEVTGGKVRLVRSISTYVADAGGNADDTLIDLQTIRTLDYVREVIVSRFKTRFARTKIADTAAGPNTTDPATIRGFMLGDLIELEAAGYVERVLEHKDLLVVERDDSVPTRVNADIPADIVDGLHIAAMNTNLILG